MTTTMVAKHAFGKKAQDVIFGANDAANKAAKIYGKENVTNGTVGAILDENENIVFLDAVKDVYLNLPASDYVAYAPVIGLDDYLETVIEQCFDEFKPEGYLQAIATTGGTGVIHHLVHNYTEIGDVVLTADWYWGAYGSICLDNQRTLESFELFTQDRQFNHASFQKKILEVAEKQQNVMIILNSPAHNPTGFSMPDDEWDIILNFFKDLVAKGKNRIILDVDVAYLDYAGEKKEVRRFFKKFSNLPSEILVVVGYTMSKGYTMYGQRIGAMIGISSSQDVIQEFLDVNQYTSRATWSNNCRPAMKTMVLLASDPEKQKAYEEERNSYYELIKERADIFMAEAAEVNLPVLPYMAGFFITLPLNNSTAICDELKKDNIFLVPLKKGVRIAICGVTKKKVQGMAKKIYEAAKKVGAL